MSRDVFVPVLLGSFGLHALATLALPVAPANAAAAPVRTTDVTLEAPPPRPRPKIVEPPPTRPTPPTQRSADARSAAPSPAARAPAAAARVIDAPPDSSPGLADFTLVQGDAATFSGGVTEAAGARRPTPGAAGAGDGSSLAAPLVGPDRSRTAQPGAAAWSCSHLFPRVADELGVHQAVVRVSVRVGADGRALTVQVLSDPGNGFAAAARACASAQRYTSARDRSGADVVGTTPPFSVRFSR